MLSEFIAGGFALDVDEKGVVWRLDADVCRTSFRVMPKLPFLLKDDVFRAVAFFKKAVDALQYDEVLILRKVGRRVVTPAKTLRP